MSLEKYLKGEPLNDDMKALMEGREDEPADDDLGSLIRLKTDEINDDDREHLRRLQVDPGWPVLLKLLDSDIERQEDAAKRRSLDDPLGSSLNAVWADVAYQKKGRDKIVALIQSEVEKLKKRKKKKA